MAEPGAGEDAEATTAGAGGQTAERPNLAISEADVRAAAERIAGAVHVTPVITCSSLDALAGSGLKLHFKAETFQKSGSFKVRGAVNAVRSLSEAAAASGVCAHSSGNHAAAVAYAASLRGVPAHIVVPTNTPRVKTAAVEAYGGTLYFCEPTMDAREAECSRIQAKTGAAFVHPYNDPRVMAGQGTIALEFLEQVPQLDAIVVPISGGGMISGIATVAKARRAGLRVLAAEPTGVNDAADAAAAKAAGRLVPCPRPATVADGLQGRLGSNTWPVVRELVDAVVTVTEEEIVDAMRLLFTRAKLVVEPSGAAGLAAVLRASREARDGNDSGGGSGSGGGALAGCANIGIILCGGNADIEAKGFFGMEHWPPGA